MQIKCVVSAVGLSVNVTVANERQEPLYLANCNFDYYGLLDDPKYAYSRNKYALPTRRLAYASLQGETLELLQGEGPPPPPDVQMIAPRVALYTRLPPGETMTGQVYVPFPICEWNAYSSPKVDGSKEVGVSRVSLSVEYFRQSMAERVTPHPSYRDVFRVSGYPPELLTATAALPQPLKAHKRPEGPKRMPVY